MDFPIRTVTHRDAEYPHLLLETAGHPAEIHVRGELPAQNELCIAIVGTRKATREGKALAYTCAEELAKRGFVIVSGLALGVDGAAHDGALAANGKTIAVLANGLDSIYPRQHEHLAELILENGGGIISEYPDDSPSFPSQFLERNRIVSGLCIATVVIEAPLRSGSISTARNAIEQGREVFVFPGAVNHTNYQGSHRLLRDGARLVTGYKDILADLGMSDTENNQHAAAQNDAPDDADEAAILNMLTEAGEPLSIDRICELTTLHPRIVSEKLTMLTLSGTVSETAKGFTLT